MTLECNIRFRYIYVVTKTYSTVQPSVSMVFIHNFHSYPPIAVLVSNCPSFFIITRKAFSYSRGKSHMIYKRSYVVITIHYFASS